MGGEEKKPESITKRIIAVRGQGVVGGGRDYIHGIWFSEAEAGGGGSLDNMP